MNKLREAREILIDVQQLVADLWADSQKMRALLQRMIDKHGNIAQGGEVNVPNNREFYVGNETDGGVEVRVYDTEFPVHYARLANRYHELMEDK